jgi:hypothetical protein
LKSLIWCGEVLYAPVKVFRAPALTSSLGYASALNISTLPRCAANSLLFGKGRIAPNTCKVQELVTLLNAVRFPSKPSTFPCISVILSCFWRHDTTIREPKTSEFPEHPTDQFDIMPAAVLRRSHFEHSIEFLQDRSPIAV